MLDDQRKRSNSIYILGPVKEDHYRKHWEKYCEANGIPKITPYEMRHTFVSTAKSLSEGQIKSIVGHSQNMDTFGTYGHQMNGDLQKTAAQLDRIFTDILSEDHGVG